jgi:hypothetical protein
MRCTGRGYVVHDAIDRMQAAGRAVLERRIPGGEPVAFPEPEKADHTVDVDEEKRLLFSFDHKECVTNKGSGGTLEGSVQSAVQNLPEYLKVEGYGSEI